MYGRRKYATKRATVSYRGSRFGSRFGGKVAYRKKIKIHKQNEIRNGRIPKKHRKSTQTEPTWVNATLMQQASEAQQCWPMVLHVTRSGEVIYRGIHPSSPLLHLTE